MATMIRCRNLNLPPDDALPLSTQASLLLAKVDEVPPEAVDFLAISSFFFEIYAFSCCTSAFSFSICLLYAAIYFLSSSGLVVVGAFIELRYC